VGIIIALAAGAALGYFARHLQLEREAKTRQGEADRILETARAKARETELKARDEGLRIRDEGEAELSRRRAELTREEERLQRRRSEVDRRLEGVEKRDQLLNKRQSALDRRQNDMEALHAQTLAELQRVSGMTQDDAKAQLLAAVEKEARSDMARIIRQIEEQAQEEGERRARELIADAIQRVASDHVAEVSVSVVPLPSDEMKGRIIGRNGRNIRAFEQAAGVDVVVEASTWSSTTRPKPSRSPASIRCGAKSPAGRWRNSSWTGAFIRPTSRRSSISRATKSTG
jgi:ribonuclease Y